MPGCPRCRSTYILYDMLVNRDLETPQSLYHRDFSLVYDSFA